MNGPDPLLSLQFGTAPLETEDLRKLAEAGYVDPELIEDEDQDEFLKTASAVMGEEAVNTLLGVGRQMAVEHVTDMLKTAGALEEEVDPDQLSPIEQLNYALLSETE